MPQETNTAALYVLSRTVMLYNNKVTLCKLGVRLG